MRRAVMTMTSSAERFRASAALLVAAALAVGLLLMVDPAGAAFPGTNGKIVFESSRLGGSNIFAMNSDGTGATLLTDKNDVNPKEDPAVSPDGSKITYVYGRDIWVMNSDGSGPRNLTNDADFNAQPAWSADGTKIAFAKDFDLFTMNADGTGKTNITNTPNNQESDPAFSPDGSQIAYTRSGCEVAGGGGSCVYKINADGSGTPTNLTTEPGHKNVSRHPSWSPDGTKIAFRGVAGSVGTTGTDIWVMNSDGSAKTDIINDNGTDDGQPAYSPDGQKIVFSSDRDDPLGEVYVMDKDGSKPIRLTNDPESDGDPAFSPDGSKIAFVSFRSGFPNAEIYVVNADGSGTPTNLTNNSAKDLHPDWQPVCTISGTTGDDFITANQSPGNDVICGLGGSDQIDAGGGHDVVIGGNENDFIVGGSGRDRVFGGLGNDTLNVRDGVRRNDFVDGGDGTDACKRDRGDKKVSCEQ